MTKFSIIEELPQIVRNGMKAAEKIMNRPLDIPMEEKEIIKPMTYKGADRNTNKWMNQFYQQDNLIVIENLLKKGYEGKIDLIYIDPPFLTKTNYNGRSIVKYGKTERVIEHFAYNDIWDNGLITYLEMLYIRLYLMKKLLSDRGSIYLHLDYRTVHYAKILMDQIFGEGNFLNEIIWSYKSGGVSKRYYSRKHDNILVYSKTKDYIFNPQKEKSYNRDFKPYRFKGIKEYKDEIGWYTLVNLRDVWPIDMVGRTAKERVGYDTQKPEKLLERIILSSSNEGSIIADFFAGSGTTGVVGERLNRRWIMADKGALSLITTTKRLIEKKSLPFSIIKEHNNLGKAGRLSIKTIETIKSKEGIEGLNIELDNYELNLDNIGIKGKYKDIVKEIALKNSLALIDFIGIDIDYNGNIPTIDWQDYRRDDKMIINSNIKVFNKNLKGSNKIYIKYIDIFGQQNSMVYKIDNGV